MKERYQFLSLIHWHRFNLHENATKLNIAYSALERYNKQRRDIRTIGSGRKKSEDENKNKQTIEI